ncbi:MAG: Zn-dependent protease [Bradymonadia bacterium]|jgi:Zn-dependent protease
MFGTNIGPSYRLFRAFGIPVEASASSAILLVMVLFAFGGGSDPANMIASLLVAAVVFISVIAHELGHGLAVKKLGHGIGRVVLGPMGGVLIWDGTRATRADRVKVSLAGPAVSLMLAVIGFLAYLPFHHAGGYGWAQAMAEPVFGLKLLKVTFFSMATLNLMWAVFNMLPIYPLDGGQALRSAMGMKMRQRAAMKRSLQVSMVTAGLGVVAGALTGTLFIPILLGYLAYMNWQEWQRNF